MRKDAQLLSGLRRLGDAATLAETDLTREGFARAGVDWGWCGRLALNPRVRNSWKPQESALQPSVLEMALPHSKIFL